MLDIHPLREPHDFYPTPPEGTRALLSVERSMGRSWSRPAVTVPSPSFDRHATREPPEEHFRCQGAARPVRAHPAARRRPRPSRGRRSPVGPSPPPPRLLRAIAAYYYEVKPLPAARPDSRRRTARPKVPHRRRRLWPGGQGPDADRRQCRELRKDIGPGADRQSRPLFAVDAIDSLGWLVPGEKSAAPSWRPSGRTTSAWLSRTSAGRSKVN